MFRRFLTEPGLVGLDWAGFRDAQIPARRFASDGYLGEENGRLMVAVGDDAAGFLSYLAGLYGGACVVTSSTQRYFRSRRRGRRRA